MKRESVTCTMPSSLLSFHSLNEQRSAVINGRPRGGRERWRERRREAECMQMCVRESQTGGVKACMSHLSAPNAMQAAISVVFWIVPERLEAPGAWVNTAPAFAAAPPTTAAALSSRFFSPSSEQP